MDRRRKIFDGKRSKNKVDGQKERKTKLVATRNAFLVGQLPLHYFVLPLKTRPDNENKTVPF